MELCFGQLYLMGNSVSLKWESPNKYNYQTLHEGLYDSITKPSGHGTILNVEKQDNYIVKLATAVSHIAFLMCRKTQWCGVVRNERGTRQEPYV
jgi:hypothetical protein